MLKIASLLQYALPGVPCIYYGDDVGIEGWIDPFNRRCYPWGNENAELLEHYKMLGHLRKNNVFKEGKYKCLVHEEGVFIFKRYDDNEKIVIGINLSDEVVTLRCNEPMKEYGNLEKTDYYNIESKKYIILN